MTTLVAPTPEAGSKAAQILEAAGALFLENGYGAVSMDAVSKKANVSKATLYAHFGSKDELFRAMVACECANSALAEVWEEARPLPAAEGLRLIGLKFVSFVMSSKALSVHRVVLGEAHRFPELARAFYDAGPALTFAQVRAHLDELVRRGELSIPDLDLATHQFFGLVKANLHLQLMLCLEDRPSDEKIERFVNAAVALFVKGYAPAEKP
ncbi:TetR/AcrR family transcriptional regulator [Azospirillum agricola]|uniref:TetR/AcrR family transcriptional regulator n=1 Tax=Azospirillum agricola TaxID=1720247 RepID=UPI000A0F0295|nr:TetR/AcrR family transcriptional regulator [Azospirillum agricola]SMH44944.1 transcriptional regulator, TetR family [Azospirillum lipoferum]